MKLDQPGSRIVGQGTISIGQSSASTIAVSTRPKGRAGSVVMG